MFSSIPKPRHVPVPASGALGLIMAVAAFIAVVDNGAFWSTVSQTADIGLTHNLGFGIAIALALMAFLMLVLSLFGCKYLLKPALVVLLLFASVTSYFMDVYGIVVDDTMVQNVLETTAGEAGGLMSPRLVVHLLLTGMLPALVVCVWRVRWKSMFRETGVRLVTMAAALAVVLGTAYWHYKDFALVLRSHRELRYLVNPTYPLYAIGEAFTRTARADIPIQPIGTDAHQARPPNANRKIVILVVGETARAADFSLDGYARNTNPRLGHEDIVNFPQFYSCGTSTAVSVPCMFSRLTRDNYDDFKAKHTQNLLDVLSHASVSVLWRDNNTGCKQACARVPTEDLTGAQLPGLCNENGCFDDVLLHGLQDRIDAAAGDMFIVLHQLGSHGPAYYQRYPERFKRFTPVCNSNVPQECSRRAIVNAYDNTIVYTDYFLDQVIELLRRNAHRHDYDTALFYVSDHGESLGENGLYLHGFPYMIAPEEQKHVPALAWFSAGFRSRLGAGSACLNRVADQRYSHDNLFDTMLGLLDVKTRVYNPARDIFQPCRRISVRRS